MLAPPSASRRIVPVPGDGDRALQDGVVGQGVGDGGNGRVDLTGTDQEIERFVEFLFAAGEVPGPGSEHRRDLDGEGGLDRLGLGRVLAHRPDHGFPDHGQCRVGDGETISHY